MDNAFDDITKEFLAAARRENLPETIATNIVELHKGPVSSIEAFITWKHWYNALPGDPVGNLTISDIHKMFQQGADDWKRTQKASDNLWAYLTDTTNVERATDRAKAFEWQSLRNSISNALGSRKATSEDLLSFLGTPISFAQKGLVRELAAESIRQYGDSAAEHATLLAELERGGLARLALVSGGKGYSPYWRAGAVAAGWTVAFAGTAVLCGLASLPIAAATSALAAGGYAGYCLHRLREDPDFSPVN